MSLQITIPPQLEKVIAERAAEVRVDVQTYVVDTLSESLSEPLLAPVLPSDRPIPNNGLGGSPKHTESTVDAFLETFSLLRDERGIFPLWQDLVRSMAIFAGGSIQILKHR